MEILFRGKPDIDQEWLEEMELTLDEHMENLTSANYKNGFVYGQLVYSGKQPYIVGEVVESTDEWITFEYWIPVKPETVGQYTGLKDKNSKKIFEGDVLYDDYWEAYGIVVFDDGGFRVNICDLLEDLFEFTDCPIVGNKWDNPELLEVLEDD